MILRRTSLTGRHALSSLLLSLLGSALASAQISGTYSGEVDGTILSRQANRSGVFDLGVWSIAVTPTQCDDCDPGQYNVFAFNGFSGIEYSDGSRETGSFLAVVNSNGNVIGAGMDVQNCSSLNPRSDDLSPVGVPFALDGFFQGGRDSEVPGATLRIDGNTLHGRISGRDCWGERITADVNLLNAAARPTSCLTNTNVMCLNGGRYAVSASWENSSGQSGEATAIPLTANAGYFWFFDPTNIEMVVKVIDGCVINDDTWVFAAGLTNVQVVLDVVDSVTRERQIYTNNQGSAFAPIQDTTAFACATTR